MPDQPQREYVISRDMLAPIAEAVLKAISEQTAAPAQPQRYCLGLAYQAGPDPRIMRGADGGRDYFTAEELEKAAWRFMQGPREVGIGHADGTTGSATVVESYIWRGEPWQVGDVVVKAGDWLIGAILDERSWAMAERGELTGFSPQGAARRLRSGTS